MESNQKLSILFWLFKAKTSKDGKVPVYARITTDGLEEEISMGRKTFPKFRDNKLKLVTEGSMEARITNQKIAQVKADLERHFMILQSQQLYVTPAMLKNAYFGLPATHRKKEEQERNPASVYLPFWPPLTNLLILLMKRLKKYKG